jgi:hypothetical protein
MSNRNINLGLARQEPESIEDIEKRYEAKKIEYKKKKEYQKFLEEEREKEEKEKEEKKEKTTLGDLYRTAKDNTVGYTVNVTYDVKEESSITPEVKIVLSVISTLIVGYFMFFLMIIYLAPVFMTIQNQSISFSIKLILAIVSLLSPFTILPILLVFCGPYHIYTSYETMFRTDILYLFSTIPGMNTFKFTSDTMTREYVDNLGTFLGYIYYIGFVVLVGYTAYTTTRLLLPRLFKSTQEKAEDEDVLITYYEENKDKDIHKGEKSQWISVSTIFGGLRRSILGF